MGAIRALNGEQKQCICCGRTCVPGVEIAGSHLCASCELLITLTKPGEDGYDRLVEGCKAIWSVFAH